MIKDPPEEYPSSEAVDLRTRIIGAARQLFYNHGYSKVSTTEIAQAIGISKKTLYKEFETKEEILHEVVVPKLRESSRALNLVLRDPALSYMERLETIMQMIGFQYQKVSQILMRDVSIHAPNVWQEISDFRRDRYKKFEALLREGIESGVFRSDIKPEVILRMYATSVESMMNPSSLGDMPCTAQEVFHSLLTVMLSGALKDDARKSFVASQKKQSK